VLTFNGIVYLGYRGSCS